MIVVKFLVVLFMQGKAVGAMPVEDLNTCVQVVREVNEDPKTPPGGRAACYALRESA